jgi:hypothetical protein
VWVRASASDDRTTHVEVAGLDRSTAGDVEAEVAAVVTGLRELKESRTPAEEGT